MLKATKTKKQISDCIRANQNRPQLFKKGQSGCPTGRPKGITNKYSIAELFHTLAGVEKEQHKTLLQVYCRRAFKDEDSRVLLHLIERFLPSLRAMELSGGLSTKLSPEDAQAIRDEIQNLHNAEH